MEKTKDKSQILLQGNPFWNLLIFSIPFIIGDFCQQMYNAIDSMIVGNVVGENALAALGVANPIMSIIIFLLMGLSMGAGVVISQHYGAEDFANIKKIMSTALILGSVITLVLCAFCIALTKPILSLLHTPAELVKDTTDYLYIIYAGGIFCYLYNFYCYALRSIGKSSLPLIFLLLSVAINAGLDLLFVIVFKWGVKGAGFATIIAQFVSVVACMIYTYTKIDMLKLGFKDLTISKRYIRPVLSYGITFAIQQVYVYVGRVMIQGLVNSYNSTVIAGINTSYKVDSILQTPVRGYTNAFTTFTAQNMGKGQISRIKQGYNLSWIFLMIYSLITFLVGYFGAEFLSGMFVGEESAGVIKVGADAIKAISVAYIFTILILQSQALFKGMGMLKTFFAVTIMSITSRVGFSYLFEHFMGLKGIYWAVPASWFVGGMTGLVATIAVFLTKLKTPNKVASAGISDIQLEENSNACELEVDDVDPN